MKFSCPQLANICVEIFGQCGWLKSIIEGIYCYLTSKGGPGRECFSEKLSWILKLGLNVPTVTITLMPFVFWLIYIFRFFWRVIQRRSFWSAEEPKPVQRFLPGWRTNPQLQGFSNRKLAFFILSAPDRLLYFKLIMM